MLDRLARIEALLAPLPDPEIPVVSLAELGILRGVRAGADGTPEVVITPTYSGCPAMHQIEDDIHATLRGAGESARVVTQLAPAWTTDWITAEARDKLRAYGIAPPAHAATVVQLVRGPPPVAVPCPRCGSMNTTQTSPFGSTACKALHRCLDCLEPFDHFKPY